MKQGWYVDNYEYLREYPYDENGNYSNGAGVDAYHQRADEARRRQEEEERQPLKNF